MSTIGDVATPVRCITFRGFDRSVIIISSNDSYYHSKSLLSNEDQYNRRIESALQGVSVWFAHVTPNTTHSSLGLIMIHLSRYPSIVSCEVSDALAHSVMINVVNTLQVAQLSSWTRNCYLLFRPRRLSFWEFIKGINDLEVCTLETVCMDGLYNGYVLEISTLQSAAESSGIDHIAINESKQLHDCIREMFDQISTKESN